MVLLHGLARTRRSMRRLESRLRGEGWRTLNVGYPSTRRQPDELVELLHHRLGPAVQVRPKAGDETAETRRAAPSVPPPSVHFVTHSLGGLLLRALLDRYEIPALGRVVQLAPPNRGSEIVDRIGAWRAFGWIFGPTGRALGTGPGSLPSTLGVPAAEVGVIAGSRSINPLGSLLLPGAGDGAVTLARTRLGDGAEKDWIVLPLDHTTIMMREEAARQTVHFLRHGRFDHAAKESGG